MAGRPDPRGALVDLGGRRLHVVRAGPEGAQPLVLLEAGSFGFSADWAVVQAKLVDRGLRSLAYDRAGLGLSDAGPRPRDGLAVATDLERLLTSIKENGPLVLVGHSMAGLHVSLFAARNRSRVVGLVLVDAFTPAMARQPIVHRGARVYRRLSRLAAIAASAGLLQPFRGWGDRIGLVGPAVDQKRWAFADSGHNRTAAEEVMNWDASVRQALEAGPIDPACPVAVVAAGGAHTRSALKALMAEAGGGVVHVAGAGHASLLGSRFADPIVAAVERVVKPISA